MSAHVRVDMSGEWAAPRDASSYNHPNVHSRKVVHVNNGYGQARCSGVLLADDARAPLERISELSRCRRPACRQQWPATPSAPEGDQP